MSIDYLVEKTEKAVETAFLWLKILKALKRRPSYMSELRRQLKPFPPMRTLQINMYLMEKLGLIRRDSPGRLKKWYVTEKGLSILERATEHLRKQMEMLLEL
jgi:DNA-binding HxlR family transcriptional regulator